MTDTFINTVIEVITKQRDGALNEVARVAGMLADAQKKIKDLEDAANSTKKADA